MLKNYTFLVLLLLSFGIINSQTITTSSITQTSFCAGGSIVINFTTTGTFNSGNVFTAQMSNSTGSFANPVAIGSTPLNTGIILATIPSNTTFGIGYKVRVVSSNPAIIGSTCPNSIYIVSNITPATITATPNKPICMGDSVKLTVGYNSSYLWSNGKTTQTIYVRQSGTFYVKVTNIAGCDSYSDTVTVVVNPLPVVNLGNDIQSCKGDTVHLNAGTGFKKYNWNNGLDSTQKLNVTISGNYNVFVSDSNFCKAGDTINVRFNSLPVIMMGHDTSVCKDVYILDAGTGFLYYNWNNGLSHNQTFNVTSSGQYIVMVTDTNNCKNADTVNVSLNVPPLINLGNDISFCGNSISLDAGNGYQYYNWNNGLSLEQSITIQSSGLYYVVVTDSNACSGTDSINVTVNQLPNTPLITQNHDTLFSSSMTGNQWYSLSSGLIQNAVNNYLVPPASGYYYDIVTLNGCSSDTSVLYKFDLNSIKNIDCYTNINIFPNPAGRKFSIIFNYCNYQKCTYKIENVLGQIYIIKSLVLNNTTTENIDLSNFPSGLYFVKIYFENHEKTFKLFIK
jgi:hypothetical protein